MSVSNPSLALVIDRSDAVVDGPPVRWAVDHLLHILGRRGVSVRPVASLVGSGGGPAIVVAGQTAPATRSTLLALGVAVPEAPESLAILPAEFGDRQVVIATGTDVRGIVYAVLELADRAEHADDPLAAMMLAAPIAERPANPIRGINRLFVSDVEDLPWFLDRDGWQRYLTMMATHRYNRLHLAFGIGHDFLRGVLDAYLLFAYPFLVDVPGYDVRAVDPRSGQAVSAAERTRNLDTLRFISDAAAARGIHFQLGIWTHGYEWEASPDASHVITGLTAENHAAYCRDAMRAVLQACPNISGVTLRVHGESGVTEGNEGFWETVFQGAATCGRTVELDLHPKGVDRPMIDLALKTGLPVTISPKYTAEHMGLPAHQIAIRPNEQRPDAAAVGAGDHFVESLMNRSAFDLRYTRYGYADFLEEDRQYGVFFRIWPGTQRLLLWGDPALAAGYGREGTLAGCLGVEVMEPLSFKGRRGSGLPGGRDAYADTELKPAGGAWEKYAYTFRLFGRLLYNPEADADSWQRALGSEFGPAAPMAEEALACASRILPLVTSAHMPSAANNRYWPEIYTNMPICEAGRPNHYRDSPEPRRFGTASPHDPGLFTTIEECADQIVAGQRDGRYTPLWIANQLDALADNATDKLQGARAASSEALAPRVRHVDIDVSVQAALGHFFASKLRAGVAYALSRRTGSVRRLREAVEAYTRARAAWTLAIEHGDVYRQDITVGGEPFLRGHWKDRLAAIDDDLGDMRAELASVASSEAEDEPIVPLGQLEQPAPSMFYDHVAPSTFTRGEPLPIALVATCAESPRLSVRLHYRQLSQAERWQSVEMAERSGQFTAEIPAAVTDSPFAVQYFFEVRDRPDRAWMYPGLEASLANRPYVVVRQT